LTADVISLLRDLVRIPSVCGEESEIAAFIANWVRANDMRAELLEVKPNRPDVLCRLSSGRVGPRILLNGHMDTVAPGGGWTHDPFGAEVENGGLYGRGAIDMKSGLASILAASAYCRAEGLPKRRELLVTAVVDEEAYDWGTYALVQNGITKGIDFAMISESTGLRLATAHFGRAVFEVYVHGKAAHSSTPSRGINAIEKAGVLQNALQKIEGPIHPKMGRPIVNTLRIEGRQQETMLVPDTCRIVIDRCPVPGYLSKTALEDLNKLITQTGVAAEAELVARETPFCDPFEISEDEPYVQAVLRAEKVLGEIPGIEFHDGPCDSCILINQGKVPTWEFGPSGGGLHEPDGFAELESVRKTTAIYEEIVRRFMS
jgi:succinyl-diaminopimelate desuccinylase